MKLEQLMVPKVKVDVDVEEGKVLKGTTYLCCDEREIWDRHSRHQPAVIRPVSQADVKPGSPHVTYYPW